MDRNKLRKQMQQAQQRLVEMFEEVGALVAKRRLSQTFGYALQEAVLNYAEASVAANQAQEKKLARLEQRLKAFEQALRKPERNLVHARGLGMTVAGPTDRFQRVHVSFPNAKEGEPKREWLWARKVGPTTAKLDNIPFLCPTLALGDLVRVNKEGEVTHILEHGARTRLLRYADPRQQTERQLQQQYVALQETLEAHDIVTETTGVGLCAASVPGDLDDTQLAVLVDQAGAQVLDAADGNQGPMGLFESVPG